MYNDQHKALMKAMFFMKAIFETLDRKFISS